jgi:pimeloyl-ACP methyl ester carboxylesterase
VGHSQGGGIAARLAGELEGVSAVAMLAGSTFPFRHGISGQLRRIADIRLGQLDLVNAWVIGRSADDFDACLEQARATPDAPQACLHGVTARAFDQEAERAATTLPTLSRLAVPVFAIQGQLDRNIDPRSLDALAEALAPRDAEIHVVAGVGHTLVHEDDADAPRLSPDVAERLATFVESVPRR